MHHNLKIYETHYRNVACGDKTFEIRLNDRGYQKGDTINLTATHKTGVQVGGLPSLNAKITYVTGFQQQPNWVVFGIELTD